MWVDIASIVFVCVTANHLGLIGKIESLVGTKLPIVNCPKCSSFWFSVVWYIGKMGFSVIPQIPSVLAVSFLASYLSQWLELLEGYIDIKYMSIYETIYDTSSDTTAADAKRGDSAGSVSEL